MTIAIAAALATCIPSDADKVRVHAGLENWEIEERAVPSGVIDGRWMVVAIDQRLLSGGHGFRVSIGDGVIFLQGYGGGGSQPLDYGIDGLAFRTCKDPDYKPPTEILAIGYPKRFGEAARIIEHAEQIETVFGVGLRITAGGKSITLFRE